jgi:acyl dehydratase
MIACEMDKVLMAGHELRWTRPFEPDEDIVIEITLDDVFDKGPKRFAVVRSRFTTPEGEEIQQQFSTFTQPAPGAPCAPGTP